MKNQQCSKDRRKSLMMLFIRPSGVVAIRVLLLGVAPVDGPQRGQGDLAQHQGYEAIPADPLAPAGLEANPHKAVEDQPQAGPRRDAEPQHHPFPETDLAAQAHLRRPLMASEMRPVFTPWIWAISS